MRYRIVIDVEIDETINRAAVNKLAMEMMDVAVTTFSSPVFLSTEKVSFFKRNREPQALRIFKRNREPQALRK